MEAADLEAQERAQTFADAAASVLRLAQDGIAAIQRGTRSAPPLPERYRQFADAIAKVIAESVTHKQRRPPRPPYYRYPSRPQYPRYQPHYPD